MEERGRSEWKEAEERGVRKKGNSQSFGMLKVTVRLGKSLKSNWHILA